MWMVNVASHEVPVAKKTVFSSSFQVDNSCFLLCLLRMSVMLLCHLGETSQCNNKEIQLSVHCNTANTNTCWSTNTNTYCLVVQSSAAVNACLRIPTGTSFNHSSVARGANNRPDKLFSSLSPSLQSWLFLNLIFIIVINELFIYWNYFKLLILLFESTTALISSSPLYLLLRNPLQLSHLFLIIIIATINFYYY